MKRIIIAALLLLASIPALAFDMTDCTVYFSPRGGVMDALVKYIGTAKKSVRVLAYNFTSRPIADALVDAHKRNVDVQVVLDRSVPTERGSALPELLAAGIPTWIDKAHRIAHNKVILVDGAWIETGSFNFSPNAEYYNGENAIVCRSPEAYSDYLADWQKHESHSEVAK